MAKSDETQKLSEFDKDPALIHRLLLNKTLRVLIALLIVSILIPAFAYVFFFSREILTTEKSNALGTCGHPTRYHIACGLQNITKSDCYKIGCCFGIQSGCYHTLPSAYQYTAGSQEWNNEAILRPIKTLTSFNVSAVKDLRLRVTQLSKAQVHFHIFSETMQAKTIEENNVENVDYIVKIFSKLIFVEVKRKSTGKLLFSSSQGPFIVTENFIEWSFYLGGDVFHGLGESILTDRKYLLINSPTYSSLPVIIVYDTTSDFYHAVTFSSSGFIEIEMMKSNLFVIRSSFTVAEGLELNLFTGPTPADIYDQMESFYKNRYVQPYYMYGPHICSSKWPEDVNMSTISDEIETLFEEKVLFESHCLHDNLFFLLHLHAETTENVEILNRLKAKLKEQKKKFFVSLMPFIEFDDEAAYKLAEAEKIFIKFKGCSYIGMVRGKNVSYIDWNSKNPNLNKWLIEIWNEKIHKLEADGYFLQDSWLPDDRNKSLPDQKDLIYLPDNLNNHLQKSIAWNATLSDSNSKIVNHMNMFAAKEVEQISNLLQSENVLIASVYGLSSKSAVVSQNYSCTWSELRKQVNYSIVLSMCGFKNFGVTICGDTNETVSEEICMRWYQFGSFLPLMRILNDRTTNKFSKFASRSMTTLIKRRYMLMGHLNSVIIDRGAYLRPMFYHYKEVRNYSSEMTEQFMIGDSLLLAPVLLPRVSHIAIYFPETYYEFWSGMKMEHNTFITYSVVETEIPLFIRQGSIIAVHNIIKFDEILKTRLSQLNLVAAFSCNSKLTQCNAQGKLLLNENFRFVFQMNITTITLKIESNGEVNNRELICGPLPIMTSKIGKIKIYGHPVFNKTTIQPLNADLCISDSITYLI